MRWCAKKPRSAGNYSGKKEEKLTFVGGKEEAKSQKNGFCCSMCRGITTKVCGVVPEEENKVGCGLLIDGQPSKEKKVVGPDEF